MFLLIWNFPTIISFSRLLSHQKNWWDYLSNQSWDFFFFLKRSRVIHILWKVSNNVIEIIDLSITKWRTQAQVNIWISSWFQNNLLFLATSRRNIYFYNFYYKEIGKELGKTCGNNLTSNFFKKTRDKHQKNLSSSKRT